MSDQPTPETDALVTRFWHGGGIPDIFAHARQLERERDEAREKYDELATDHMLDVNKLCNERREAQNMVTDIAFQLVRAECRAERFCQERDEAREVLREIKAADWKTAGELRGKARQALEGIE